MSSYIYCVLLLIFCNLYNVNCSLYNVNQLTKDNQIRVFLTLSSLAEEAADGSFIQRRIQMNWHVDSPERSDSVGLYTSDPFADGSRPVIVVNVSAGVDRYTTDVQFPFAHVHESAFRMSCLLYWIAYVRNDVVVSQSCLRLRADWMAQLDGLGDLCLRTIMFPGTHDSGSYQKYAGKESERLITKFSVTQDEDVWHQLVYGIRYFDLRLTYRRETDEKFWITHGDVKMHPLHEILRQIAKFVMHAEKEIILVDVHRLRVEGTRLRSHHFYELYRIMWAILGTWMLPYSGTNVKIQQIWNSRKRVVVSIPAEFPPSGIFWPPVDHMWANTDQPDCLFSFLEKAVNASEGFARMWSLNAELTASAVDVLLDKYGGIRGMAEVVSANVSRNLYNLWADGANIVIVDFFHSTAIVDAAIESNLRRIHRGRSMDSNFLKSVVNPCNCSLKFFA